MDNTGIEPPQDRSRLGWWLFVAFLTIVAAFIAAEFVGILVLGVFGYYATRPINDRIGSVVDSDDVAAWTTVLVVLVPLLVLVIYAGIRVVQEVRDVLGGSGVLPQRLLEAVPAGQLGGLQSLVQNPAQIVSNPQRMLDLLSSVGSVASVAFGIQMTIAFAITLTFFFLANEEAIAKGYRRLCGGTDTTAYAYAAALDEDFESVWFGNFLFVLLMAAIGTAAYWVTNLLAPAGLHVPMIFVLGFLTGVASLIPFVVSKIVYMPVVAYLAFQASRADGTPFLFVGVVLAVYFFLLDFLPQTFLQPYVTGRQLDTVMMMFGYLLGPMLFGWYGLFLLPMIFIVMLEAIRIVVPNLVRGEPLTTGVEMGDSVGTTPRAERDAVPERDGADGDAASAPDEPDDRDSPGDSGENST